MYTALCRRVIIELAIAAKLLQLFDNAQPSIFSSKGRGVRTDPDAAAFGFPAFFKSDDQFV